MLARDDFIALQNSEWSTTFNGTSNNKRERNEREREREKSDDNGLGNYILSLWINPLTELASPHSCLELTTSKNLLQKGTQGSVSGSKFGLRRGQYYNVVKGGGEVGNIAIVLIGSLSEEKKHECNTNTSDSQF
jgi:hypothetical protein